MSRHGYLIGRKFDIICSIFILVVKEAQYDVVATGTSEGPSKIALV